MALQYIKSALAVMAGALALATAQATPMSVSAWAEANFVLPDGPSAGQKFSLSVTPYLREPLDFFADACPDNRQAVRKAKQTAFTTAAMIATGYTADQEPCDLFVIEPTDSSLSEFLSLKLQPSIEASPALAAKIDEQVSRSGKKSTTFVKRYRGGSALFGTATSTADLRGKTRRKVIRDEASEYPEDVGGQGSPHVMIAGSYESFLKAGNWKDWAISTPVVKGACKIDEEFQAGDQRYWFVKCPGCGFAVNFEIEHLKYNATPPYKAHHVSPCCGAVVEEYQRQALMRSAETDGFGWIATAPGPGRYRSYHFDTLSSPFVPWDVVAQREIESRDDPIKRKTFDNLTLGIAHEIKGDAPDRDRLMTLREEDLKRRQIPARGLLMTGAADVQGNGIYYEIVAFTPDRQSYVVDADFLAGDTTDASGGAFAMLGDVFDREYADAYGGKRRVDAFGVDSGFRSHVVYAWTRARPNAFALKGADGWSRPALGTPATVDLDMGGRKIAHGATVWAVGTWSLKAQFYADLRKRRPVEGAECEPSGACHFGSWQDQVYFEQITAEYLADDVFKGRRRRVWKESGPNHFLDCFDPLTELLTADGWVPVAQACAGMSFATVNLANDEIEYQAATDFVDRHHDGSMVEIKGRSIDLLVTPNHRMVTYHPRRARSVPDITLAKDLTIWDKIKRTAKWSGDPIETLVIPAVDVGPRGNNRNKLNSLQQAEKTVDAGDLAEFLGWYVTEGHRGSGAGRHYAVAISQNPGLKQDRIVALMTKLGWTPRVEGGGQKIVVHSRQLHALLDDCYVPGEGRGAYRKCAPQWIKNANPRVIARFVDAAIAGDGWTQWGFRSFASTSRRLADDLQELFIKVGNSANITVRTGLRGFKRKEGQYGAAGVPQYHVSETKTRAAHLRRADNAPLMKSVAYAGRVYCVSVPNGTLIARRNGKMAIVGNCRVYNLALADYLGLSRMTPDEWSRLALHRGTPAELSKPDLFMPAPVRVAAQSDAAAAREPVKPVAAKLDPFAALAKLNAGVG